MYTVYRIHTYIYIIYIYILYYIYISYGYYTCDNLIWTHPGWNPDRNCLRLLLIWNNLDAATGHMKYGQIRIARADTGMWIRQNHRTACEIDIDLMAPGLSSLRIKDLNVWNITNAWCDRPFRLCGSQDCSMTVPLDFLQDHLRVFGILNLGLDQKL